MKWHIITCDNSKHIVEAQKHLFKKYVPGVDVVYIDLKSENVKTWTHNVLDKLDTSDSHIILGLDDFMPIDYFPEIEIPKFEFDRLELGWGGSRKGVSGIAPNYRLYKYKEPYRVSCQFSVWNVEALKELLSISRSPWEFEVKGQLDGNVLGLETPWRYIEESAISNRRKGMVNLCGMREDDIKDLIWLDLVDRDSIIYGWRGTSHRSKESYGKKYAQYF